MTTIAGTGKQGNDKVGGKFGTEQELSSPWDIVIGPSPGNIWLDEFFDIWSCLDRFEKIVGYQDDIYCASSG